MLANSIEDRLLEIVLIYSYNNKHIFSCWLPNSYWSIFLMCFILFQSNKSRRKISIVQDLKLFIVPGWLRYFKMGWCSNTSTVQQIPFSEAQTLRLTAYSPAMQLLSAKPVSPSLQDTGVSSLLFPLQDIPRHVYFSYRKTEPHLSYWTHFTLSTLV